MIYKIKVNGEKEESPQIQSISIKQPILSDEIEYPSFASQVHGLSSALVAKSKKVKIFWLFVFFSCTSCGIVTTGLVIMEYIKFPTATSISIELVTSLEYPAITICPRIPDALNYEPLFKDIQTRLPNITHNTAHDLISYFLAGSGLSLIKPVYSFNETQLIELNEMYKMWSDGYDTQQFFFKIQNEYGYKCEQLFSYCVYDIKERNCCKEMFKPVWVLKHGLCYQTRRNINQTQNYGVGWFYVDFKPPPSINDRLFSGQAALIVFVTDNFEHIAHSPRYYLMPDNDHRLTLNARLVELQENVNECTNNLVGQNVGCFVNKWIKNHLLNNFNCTLPYIQAPGIPNDTKVCDPLTIAQNYKTAIELDHHLKGTQCIPGCKKWEYRRAMLIRNFKQKVGSEYKFNLAIGFDELQYEHVKEFSTISISGLISQIGGQLGLYLGLSIITLFQILVYGVKKITHVFRRLILVGAENNQEEVNQEKVNQTKNILPQYASKSRILIV